ncbi:MAG: hypothetical protein AAGI22_18420 [Planctomycetota bacterium]
MRTKKTPAAELRGPEEQGAYTKKGSLVHEEGGLWRVQAIEETHPGLLEIVVQEERPNGHERHELIGAARAVWPAKASRLYDLVIESDAQYEELSQELGSKPERSVYGFKVTSDDGELVMEVFRFLAAWLDGEADMPLRHVSAPKDGSFEFRTELTPEGHLLFADARDRARRFKGRIGLDLFDGPSSVRPLPTK